MVKKEYIDCETVLEMVDTLLNETATKSARVVMYRFKRLISKISAADVVPIAVYPHGDKNYCPNCGAKMEV